MTKPDGYLTPEATWAAIRSAARNSAAAVGIPAATLQQLLLFDRLLSRVFEGEESFVLKGGTRMLAFIPRARATVDIDLETAAPSIDAAVEALDQLLIRDIGDCLRFARVGRSASPGSADQPNVTMVKLTYEAVGTRQQVKLDLAIHDRAGAATVKATPHFRVALGHAVPSPEYVMIAVEQQIADKVAAMMERHHGGDGRSSRAKDLVDLALIALNLSCDAALLREALEVESTSRKLAPFVAVDASPSIRRTFATVAKKAPDLELTWQQAETLTNHLIGPVLIGSVTSGRWDPVAGNWASMTT